MNFGDNVCGLLARPSRRQILQAASATLVPAVMGGTISAMGSSPVRLTQGWEHHRGTIGGIWEVWRGNAATSNVEWTPVSVPHSFNAFDAVDPDEEYYEGPGWYRTTIAVDNPYANGRTLLHFEGAGQRSEVFVGLERVAWHTGGYDEFAVDITEAARKAAGKVQLAVLCDNSRNLETIPSDQSDFVRFGGLYRHVNLTYVPAVSAERVLVDSVLADGVATVTVRLRVANPAGVKNDVKIDLELLGPDGKPVAHSSRSLDPLRGTLAVGTFQVKTPALWSPGTPNLYRCVLTLESAHGRQVVEDRFGVGTAVGTPNTRHRRRRNRRRCGACCTSSGAATATAAVTRRIPTA